MTADATISTLTPFRGLRYAPQVVGDVGLASAPPYDVVDDAQAAALAAASPYNLIRLTLPTRVGPDGGSPIRRPYEGARDLLRRWRAAGVLAADPRPGFYVYEQRLADGYAQRGLLGGLALVAADAHRVIPHENVLAKPLGDRLELLRACATNAEPVFGSYDGAGGSAASTAVEGVDGAEPLVCAASPDGARHRLWRIDAAEPVAAIAADLDRREVLLLDGHHRYTAASAVAAEHRAAGEGAGPWDATLALLVDERARPLRIGAIHRVVAGRTLPDAVGRARAAGWRADSAAGEPAALAALAGARGRSSAFAVSDGADWVVLTAPTPDPDGVDTGLLHTELLSRIWQVDEDAVGYVHEVDAAVRAARQAGGVAVILNPLTTAQVRAIAGRGERLPRKSTSFTPKPRCGFVLRSFADQR